jgi:hypothetical protein
MQDNARFKLFPLTGCPVDGSAIKAGYGVGKAKRPAGLRHFGTMRSIEPGISTFKNGEGPGAFTPNPSFISISRPVSRVL